MHDALARIPGLEAPPPAGAFYAYFRAPGRDGEALAFPLVDEPMSASLPAAPSVRRGLIACACVLPAIRRISETAMARLVPVLEKALAGPV